MLENRSDVDSAFPNERSRNDAHTYVRTGRRHRIFGAALLLLASRGHGSRAFSATLIKRAAYFATPGTTGHLIKRPAPSATQLPIGRLGRQVYFAEATSRRLDANQCKIDKFANTPRPYWEKNMADLTKITVISNIQNYHHH